MKVILTAEVKGKGHEGDVVEVARGYAVNYLMPRKLAVEATTGNLKQLDARMGNIQKRNDARRNDAESLAAAIEGKTVVIEAKVGDEGKLFGSVTTLMIEEAVAAQLGSDIDHRRMDLGRPIKTVGDHPVKVSVYGDVKAEVVVRVVPEGGTAEALSSAAVLIEEPVEVDAPDEPDADDAAQVETGDVAEAEVAPVEEAEGMPEDADESDDETED
jgi:large subunit ribosomal protein L9